MPSSRYHLFPIVSLYPGRRSQGFIGLLDSPFSTSQWWQTRTLIIAQNEYSAIPGEPWTLSNLFQRLMCWRSSDGNKTFPSSFPSLTKLVIVWVDWRTLTSEATSSIGFPTLAYLRLWNVPFTRSDNFLSLIESFANLETLDLEDVRIENDTSDHSVKCAKLRSLLLNGESAQMLEIMSSKVTYEAGLQHLRVHYRKFSDLRRDVLAVIPGLLRCAGPSLEKFEFNIQEAGTLDTVTDMGTSPTYYIWRY